MDNLVSILCIKDYFYERGNFKIEIKEGDVFCMITDLQPKKYYVQIYCNENGIYSIPTEVFNEYFKKEI